MRVTSRDRWASLRAVSVLSVLVLATACGLLPEREDPIENQPAQQIYGQAEFALENNRKPTDAIELFAEVERLYPYSEYAEAVAGHKAARQGLKLITEVMG